MGTASENAYLAHPVFSVTFIPPDMELINMNKWAWTSSLHSFPALCTPFCCFCQLSVHQVTNTNNFLVLPHKGFQTLDVEHESFYTRDFNLQRENSLHHIGNAIFLCIINNTSSDSIILWDAFIFSPISSINASTPFKVGRGMHSKPRTVSFKSHPAQYEWSQSQAN